MSAFDDMMYFCSIVGAMGVLMAFNIYNLEEFLAFEYSPTTFMYLIAGGVLFMGGLKNAIVLVKWKDEEKQSMWSSELGTILGAILLSSMVYASDHFPELCPESRRYQLLVWFLLARIFTLLGHVLNRLFRVNCYHALGDAMSSMITILSVGLALGFDTYLLL